MKSLTLLAFTAITLLGADGYKVYKDNCMKCHAEMMTKAEVLQSIKSSHSIKAPPMIEVANKIKNNIDIVDMDKDIKRRVVTAFIKDYIENPSIQYSMCEPMALEKFGVMPSLKGKLNEAQKQAVAEWIYDRYEGKTF